MKTLKKSLPLYASTSLRSFKILENSPNSSQTLPYPFFFSIPSTLPSVHTRVLFEKNANKYSQINGGVFCVASNLQRKREPPSNNLPDNESSRGSQARLGSDNSRRQ